ncbi:MAG: DUF956 family protein [Atopostipes suicloacalis]|nr:DUF956 family protein [Atopostipes suicloacalis]
MKEETPYLNVELDFVTRSNSILNSLAPKPGLLMIGAQGVEFRAEKGSGFIQIPWTSITEVRVQMFFKAWYVRGFFIETNENQLLEFVVSDAKEALRAMRKYLKREQFVKNPSNLQQIFKRNKK